MVMIKDKTIRRRTLISKKTGLITQLSRLATTTAGPIGRPHKRKRTSQDSVRITVLRPAPGLPLPLRCRSCTQRRPEPVRAAVARLRGRVACRRDRRPPDRRAPYPSDTGGRDRPRRVSAGARIPAGRSDRNPTRGAAWPPLVEFVTGEVVRNRAHHPVARRAGARAFGALLRRPRGAAHGAGRRGGSAAC